MFYLVALRLLGKASTPDGRDARAAGVMAALFFALHPLRAESVAWVTERRDVLSGLFFLLTILLYLAAADADGAAAAAAPRGSVIAYPLRSFEVHRHDIAAHPAPAGRLPAPRRMPSPGHVARSGDLGALLREKPPYIALGFAGAILVLIRPSRRSAS